MSTEVLRIVEYIAIVVGVFFMFVASLGVFRLKDFYMRIHAPTKAATLGLIFLLVAVAIVVPTPTVVTKAVLAVIFIMATAPVGGHLLARAAYRAGVAPAPGTHPNEYEAVARARERTGRLPTPPNDLAAEDTPEPAPR